MKIDALPSFELTFEGYCKAVTEYALTRNPYIIRWIAVVNSMRASGELVWEPTQTMEQRQIRLEAMRNAAIAISLICNRTQQK